VPVIEKVILPVGVASITFSSSGKIGIAVWTVLAGAVLLLGKPQPTVAHVLHAKHDKVGAPHAGPEQQRHRQACLGAYRMAFLELPRPLPRLPS
jgi:hypothetical protein